MTRDASLIAVFAAEAGEPTPTWHTPIHPTPSENIMDRPAFRVSLCEYADPFDSYAAAIADARRHGRMVCKYADPSEGERLDITDEEAADVMLADIGLIYISPRQNATGGAQ